MFQEKEPINLKNLALAPLFKVFTFLLIVSAVLVLVACNGAGPDTKDPNDDINDTNDDTNDSDDDTNDDTDSVDMDATLIDLTVNGITVMGFSPETKDYIVILSSEETSMPLVEGERYNTDSTLNIVNATNLESSVAADRTTTITVTTDDETESMVYSILFEFNIEAVDLGSADDFVILAETGISSETSSMVTGDMGLSPAAATYITGFSLIMDSTNTFSTSSQVVGNIYASDYTSPTPSTLTTAISDMRTAYNDAASRTATYTELYSGDLSGKTLTTGVYKFGTSVLINTDLTLHGSATDVWIFQIDGSLTQAATTDIILTGGALAENVFFQVADTVTVGTGSHFVGTILAKTNIAFNTNASIEGSLYAQTAVTLDAVTVTKP